jgi:hypothetical protein
MAVSSRCDVILAWAAFSAVVFLRARSELAAQSLASMSTKLLETCCALLTCTTVVAWRVPSCVAS